MRDKLQALVEQMKSEHAEMLSVGGATALVCAVFHNTVIHKIESILATELPAVTVRAGWVCKGPIGLHWTSERPEWFGSFGWSCFHDALIVDECITDPWPDKPNGGPECCMEVK